jgi:hypothetical protein
MAYSGQRHGGAGTGSSSRQGNGLKGQASSVEFLGRGMVGMQLRDAKPDADDKRVSSVEWFLLLFDSLVTELIVPCLFSCVIPVVMNDCIVTSISM